MSYSGRWILTILPGAWPWAATPLRRRRRRWNYPEGESFPSWTLRPPSLGGLPFLISPSRRGSIFFFLIFGGGVRRRVIGR